MKYLRVLPDSVVAPDCSCLLSIDDFVNIDKDSYELPWKPIAGLANNCSELFTNLWESWSADTNSPVIEKPVTDDNTTLQEISEYLEPIHEDMDGEIIEIINSNSENEIIPTEPEEILSQPFPEKGSKIYSQGKDSQVDFINETSQNEIEQDVSSDGEWPMEWVDFSNTYSTFPNYDNLPSFSNFSVPDDYESPLSKFPPINTTPHKESSTADTTAKVKKTKRKIGF
ncbi:hypothetical protein LOD99_13935 [Oopsacas minuta]|uniref:Uncharacterized protein n=1 Tax=Oopsacas minuta TaxID=111878 RepID=A0AAV7KGU6_9METZ|nr:hypothetical protein LOD99_13935 [Oopsacas minuta]